MADSEVQEEQVEEQVLYNYRGYIKVFIEGTGFFGKEDLTEKEKGLPAQVIITPNVLRAISIYQTSHGVNLIKVVNVPLWKSQDKVFDVQLGVQYYLETKPYSIWHSWTKGIIIDFANHDQFKELSPKNPRVSIHLLDIPKKQVQEIDKLLSRCKETTAGIDGVGQFIHQK